MDEPVQLEFDFLIPTKAPHLNVVEAYKTNYRDIPGSLRSVAGYLEDGDYGEVLEAVLVLQVPGDVTVFGFGFPANVGGSHLLLAAGQRRLLDLVFQRGYTSDEAPAG